MSELILVTGTDPWPGFLPKRFKTSMLMGDTQVPGYNRTVREFYNDLIIEARGTATGNMIHADVKAKLSNYEDNVYVLFLAADSDASTGLSTNKDSDPYIALNVRGFGTIFIPGNPPVAIPPVVILFHELGHLIQYIGRRAWFDRVSGDDVEQDNLVKHEHPLCKELGLPIRMKYKHEYKTAQEAFARWQKDLQKDPETRRARVNEFRRLAQGGTYPG